MFGCYCSLLDARRLGWVWTDFGASAFPGHSDRGLVDSSLWACDPGLLSRKLQIYFSSLIIHKVACLLFYFHLSSLFVFVSQEVADNQIDTGDLMECLVANKHQKEMNEKCAVGVTHFQLVRLMNTHSLFLLLLLFCLNRPFLLLILRSRWRTFASRTSSRWPARRTCSNCAPTSKRSECVAVTKSKCFIMGFILLYYC